jgi:hypothetical protein
MKVEFRFWQRPDEFLQPRSTFFSTFQ